MADTALKRENGGDELAEKAKKQKGDPEANPSGNGEERSEENILSAFKTTAVLKDSPRDKTIFLHGKVRGSGCKTRVNFGINKMLRNQLLV